MISPECRTLKESKKKVQKSEIQQILEEAIALRKKRGRKVSYHRPLSLGHRAPKIDKPVTRNKRRWQRNIKKKNNHH